MAHFEGYISVTGLVFREIFLYLRNCISKPCRCHTTPLCRRLYANHIGLKMMTGLPATEIIKFNTCTDSISVPHILRNSGFNTASPERRKARRHYFDTFEWQAFQEDSSFSQKGEPYPLMRFLQEELLPPLHSPPLLPVLGLNTFRWGISLHCFPRSVRSRIL